MTTPVLDTTDTPAAKPRLKPVRLSVVARLISIVVFIGIIIWFAQKTPIEGGSRIPVVHAPEAPMRIVPDNPGGLRAAYQGLAVNEVPSNQPKANAEDLLLAPPPMKLPDLTQPFDARGEAPSPQTVAELIGQILSEEDNPTVAPQPTVRTQTAPADPPKPRVIGNNFAQLGVFESEDEAVAAWIAFSIQFKPYLGQHEHVIQSAMQNDKQFYRLRVAGFADVQAVRRFCAVIKEQNADCFPV